MARARGLHQLVAMISLIAAAAAASCGKSTQQPPTPTPVTAAPIAVDAHIHCEKVAFAESTPVPEASGATWLDVESGKRVLMTMGDSDRNGAYGLLDPDTGETIEQGFLPLGAASDDLEGLATRHGLIYGLNSAGYMRSWKRVPHGFELVDGPYAIGAATLPSKHHPKKPERHEGMACDDPMATNCGRNYEGLALSEAAGAGGACVGVALAKADGVLYCLTDDGGKLVAHEDRALAVGAPGAVADCAFPDGNRDEIWLGDNFFGGNVVSRVTGWRDLATAKIESIGAYGIGFSEGIAVRGGDLYRLSDTGGAPSLIAKFRCTPSVP